MVHNHNLAKSISDVSLEYAGNRNIVQGCKCQFDGGAGGSKKYVQDVLERRYFC